MLCGLLCCFAPVMCTVRCPCRSLLHAVLCAVWSAVLFCVLLCSVLWCVPRWQLLTVWFRELTTLGDPMCDLAYSGLAYYLPPGGTMPGLGGLELDELGIPTQKQINSHYCRLRGIPVPSRSDLNFYMAFGFFRIAAIVQGVYKRGLDGNASSDSATKLGGATTALAYLGMMCSEEEEEEEEVRSKL